MDRQQIFQLISDGLLAQGATSTRTVPATDGRRKLTQMLAYRGDHGRKCAAGFLIPDILYRPEMEGHLFAYSVFDHVRTHMQISHDEVEFITHLQWVHDSCEPSAWREELAALGDRYSLDISTIWPRSNPLPVSRKDR